MVAQLMWWTIGQVTLWVIFGLAVIVTAATLAGRWYFVDRDPDEIHFCLTDDKWRIAVLRYRAAVPLPGADPLLLCGAIGANHLCLDLMDERSIARSLAAGGYDTWVVELRGRGLSSRPRLFAKYKYDWSFDEYVEKDVPVAIDAVLRATGHETLHYVGFSLGAVIGYAMLSDPRIAPKVRSAVAIGGPATYKFQRKYLFSWPIRNLRWLKHQFLMRLLAPLAGYWRPKLLNNPANMSAAVIRRFMVNATSNFAENEMLQYSDWIANDTFRTLDQRRDYRKDLAKVTTPMMFLAGNKDRLAPPPSVKDAYEAVSSTEKRFVIASSRQAMDADYGHLDLVLGESAGRDIFPVVKSWLDERSAAAEKRPAA
jgi:pimeloyl-ACP methyl ester carboxylesterase